MKNLYQIIDSDMSEYLSQKEDLREEGNYYRYLCFQHINNKESRRLNRVLGIHKVNKFENKNGIKNKNQ
jgi:hypothetical protein